MSRLLAAAAALLVIAACARVITQRTIDHDELEHAHALWLTALGDVPLHDFLEIHPPFAFMAFAPLGRGATDGDALVLRLRVLSALGHALTLLLLAANMRLGRREIHPLWIAAALLWMLAHEGTQDYVSEFRPDPWSNAALLAALLAARLQRPRYALFGFLAAVSVLWSPKLFVLPAVFAVLELVRLRRDAWRAALAMTGGGLAALAAAWLALRASGIDPEQAYALIIRFHAVVARLGGFGYGLASTLWDQRVLVAPAAGGAIVWLVLAIRRELRPNVFEISVALFLIVQLFLVPFPYKQYFTPWLLLAAVFIPFWSLPVARVRVLRDLALPAALLFVTMYAALAWDFARTAYGFARTGQYWQFMKQFSGAAASRRRARAVPSHHRPRLELRVVRHARGRPPLRSRSDPARSALSRRQRTGHVRLLPARARGEAPGRDRLRRPERFTPSGAVARRADVHREAPLRAESDRPAGSVRAPRGLTAEPLRC